MEHFDFLTVFVTVFFAYVEALFIVFGLVLVGIGSLILASEMRSTSGQKVVRSTIIGVRRRGDIYFPVFEYTGLNGETIRAESSSGSSALGDKVPGTHALIKVSDDDPSWATPRGYLFSLIAFFLLAVGSCMIGGAFYFAEWTFVTAAVWGAVAVHFLLKIRKIIIPKGQRLSAMQFKFKMKTERDLERSSLPLLQMGDIFPLLRTEQRRIYRSAPMMVIIALMMAGYGYHGYSSSTNIMAHGIKTEATLLSKPERTGGNIEYLDYSGRTIRVNDRYIDLYAEVQRLAFGIDVSAPKALNVVYLADNPKDAIIEKGVFQELDNKALLLLGGLLFFQSLKTFLKYRRLSSRV